MAFFHLFNEKSRLVVPLAVPGLAIALALLISYGQWTAFRQSWVIILVGHVVFTLPFMIRSVIAVLSSFDLSHLEEGAASLGAGFWRRFFNIVIPNAKSGILAGSLMAFTLSIGEFNLTWMLHTPFTKTLPVGLADSYASMRLEIASAYTIVFFFMIIPLLVAMQKIAVNRSHTLQSAQETMLNNTVVQTKISQKKQTLETGTKVRLKNCAKTFRDGTVALEPTSLTVDAGQTVVILGPSGCGKTTTLRIIAGLESPDTGGSVFFNGKEVTYIPIEKRNVGMVFQNYALFPNMDVYGNIGYGLKVNKVKPLELQQRVDEMLAMMQLEELRHRRLDQLSGGQKQRVALARAIAVRPKVLLLDEPLTALDAKLRDSLRVEIDSLLRSIGITAVYVTHDQSEAMALGDKIVVMNQGKIVQYGTPREIYFEPVNSFVAEFIGTLNQILCRMEEGVLHFSRSSIPLHESPHFSPTERQMQTVYFRPEHTQIVTQQDAHFTAIVEHCFFMGDRTRVVADNGRDKLFQIEAPGRHFFEKSEKIGIRLDPKSIFSIK